MNKRALLLLALIVISAGAINVLMLHRDQGWGDDFAAYIMQAQSIVRWDLEEFVQRSTFTAEASNYQFVGPVTAPWGFPLMLAPVFAVFGTKILAFKSVLIVCYLGFLVALYFLARPRLAHHEALLLTSVFAFNPVLLQASNEILSDIPFLLFSTLALCLIDGYVSEAQLGQRRVAPQWVLGFVIFMAAITRPNGSLLLLPLAIAQFQAYRWSLVEKPDRLKTVLFAAIPYLVLGICYWAQHSVLPSVPLKTLAGPSSVRFWANLGYYFWLPLQLFGYTVFEQKLLYIALLLFFGLAASRAQRRDIPILSYGLATALLYAMIGGRQGLRYMYPVLPVLILYAFLGMKTATAWLPPRQRRTGLVAILVFWGAVAAASLAASVDFAVKNMASDRWPGGRTWGAYSPGSTAMFDFVSHHTPTDSVIIFFKPRAMRLRADRNSFMTQTCDNLPEGDYIVVVKGGGTYNQILPERVETCNPSVNRNPVYDEDDWIIYEIADAP